MTLSSRVGKGAAVMIAKQAIQIHDNRTYEDVARRLRLLSLPSRLRIVDILRHREECVCALQKALDRPQPYISQQLRVLHKAGIIEQRRGGHRSNGDERYVYYRLADPWIERLVEAALGSVDPLVLPEAGPMTG
jgi:DNA-binding transcriptional ArsR family regulator